MTAIRTLTCALIFCASGCASGWLSDSDQEGMPHQAPLTVGVSRFSNSMGKSWDQLTSRKAAARQGDVARWAWRPAIPQDLPRAEIYPSNIESRVAHQVFPEFFAETVLASATDVQSPLRVIRAGSTPVQNCAQLHQAAQSALDSGQSVECIFEIADGASNNRPQMKFSPVELAGLEQIVHLAQPVTRISADDRQWIVIRDQNVRCRASVFVESDRGLVHLVLGISAVWGDPKLLPKEIELSCGDEPLRCLAVADTLDLLYGDGRHLLQLPSAGEHSFKQVSDNEEFLTPYNYERLQRQWDQEHEPSLSEKHSPALASVPGEAYPGSPVLADARALATLSWQPKLIHADGVEHIGWVMFAGRNVRRGETIALSIDLGSGPRRIDLRVPHTKMAGAHVDQNRDPRLRTEDDF